ncbi:peptidoglycan editing factor PgeF [Piscibacillus halophilus]|uniref:peptidoglycan editing factor PgeF n=1 Tax=Piscibacillus halophilus TaxID=571933 RepID=UPI001588638E|nr:peptidoglycan editing factor PgeF [Piscibacillus halophilus]
MEILELSKHQLLEVSPWKESGVRAGFSTRKGGFSEPPFDSMNLGIHVHDQKEHVLKNRQRFSELIDTNLDQWKSLNQVHSDQIVDLSEPYDDQQYIHHDPKENADGMITNVKGDVLTAFYADCVPLLFKSKNSKWIGVAHAGWKGTVQEIGPKMIQRFGEKGIKPAEMEVVIGPCISKKNYEVDQRVVDHIPPKYHNEVLTPTTEGHYLLDLKRLNFLYLVDNDLNHDDIYITNYCTYEDEEWLYSYRRDKGKTGRMMAFIYLT